MLSLVINLAIAKLFLTDHQETVGSGVGLSVSSLGVLSYQRAYRQVVNSTSSTTTTTTSVTFPLQMAIVHVENGEVQSVVWDNSCAWCGAARCAHNTFDYASSAVVPSDGKNCFVSDDSCVVSATAVEQLCELNVFVAWTGTDADGARLQSAQSRFSLLSEWQLKYGYVGPLQSSAVEVR